jgi:hypothetical protein
MITIQDHIKDLIQWQKELHWSKTTIYINEKGIVVPMNQATHQVELVKL